LSGSTDAGSLPDTFCRRKHAVTGRDASGISGNGAGRTARPQGRRAAWHTRPFGYAVTAVGAVAVPPG
jgi:hypothetical protein